MYTSGVVRATPKFTIGVVAATGGIFVVYMVDLVLGTFGRHVPLINDASRRKLDLLLFWALVPQPRGRQARGHAR